MPSFPRPLWASFPAHGGIPETEIMDASGLCAFPGTWRNPITARGHRHNAAHFSPHVEEPRSLPNEAPFLCRRKRSRHTRRSAMLSKGQICAHSPQPSQRAVSTTGKPSASAAMA